jgi:hypothetical protein
MCVRTNVYKVNCSNWWIVSSVQVVFSVMFPEDIAHAKGVLPSQVAPSHVAPSHVAPSHVAPSHVAPSHVAPSHVAPSHVAPSQMVTKVSALPFLVSVARSGSSEIAVPSTALQASHCDKVRDSDAHEVYRASSPIRVKMSSPTPLYAAMPCSGTVLTTGVCPSASEWSLASFLTISPPMTNDRCQRVWKVWVDYQARVESRSLTFTHSSGWCLIHSLSLAQAAACGSAT